MSIFFKILIIYSCTFNIFHVYSTLEPVNIAKKKIIVFTSIGGGGHISATSAVSNSLENNYDLDVINPFLDIFLSLDPVKKLSINYISCEGLYNFFLKKRWNWLANLMGDFGEYYIKSHQRRMVEYLINSLNEKKPDMIISVVPFINSAVITAAEKLNIPFLMIPTDLDATINILSMKPPIYKHFKCALSFNDPLILGKIKHIIPEDKIRFIGYPLRPEFFEKKDKELIKKDFAIPDKKPVVMVLMGAIGSYGCYAYVRILANSEIPIHIVVCLGKNDELRKKIERVRLPSHVTISIIGYTTRISDLMSVSDLIITKSGTTTVCEAIQMGLPMLLDNTLTSLKWERLNHDLIKSHNFGDVITKYKFTYDLVMKFMKNEEYRNSVKDSMKKLTTNNFKNDLLVLVDEMLREKV